MTAMQAAPFVCRLGLLMLLAFAAMPGARAEDDGALARRRANPLSDLVSVPFQNTWDENVGPRQTGSRYSLTLLPVVPVELTPELNLIVRTVLPVITQRDVFPGSGTQTGLSDTLLSLFLSPKPSHAEAWTWGLGPVALLPTGSEDRLSAQQWGLGPTGIALRQTGPWTMGVLSNHIWSVAGDKGRIGNISTSFVQPFITYTTPQLWSLVLQTEASYDWPHNDLSMPVGLFVGKLLRIGGQPIQLTAGPRYYVSHFNTLGPQGWGFRFTATLLLPK